MNIVKQTDDLLIFKENGGCGAVFQFFFIALFCLIFGGFGVFMFFSAAETTLSCKKGLQVKGQCDLKRVGLIGKSQEMIPLEAFEEADVVESTDSEGDDSYTVYLITDKGRITLPGAGGSSEYSAEAEAKRFNDFLKTPDQKTYRYHNDDRILMTIIGSFLAGIAFIVLLITTPRSKMFIFDKKKNIFLISKRGLLGSKIFGKIKAYKYTQISEVWTESYEDDGSLYYEALLGVNVDGREEEITLVEDVARVTAEKYANTVSDFLKQK